MQQVVEGENGTGKNAKITGIEICGKTGTAQNPHGEDHSIFIAFAPIKNPKIAIAVYVENGGWGATWAVPIASLMIEKYLTNSITNKTQETFILNGKLNKKRMRKAKNIFANIDKISILFYVSLICFLA